MFLTFFRTVWAILRKDLTVWVRQRSTAAATIIPPLAFLLINALGAAAVGRSPVALVTLDHGPKGIQMQQIFHQADVFRLTDATQQQAQMLLKNLTVVAVITIPADFTQRVEAHQNSPVDVTVNNLNLDFTNDIRRSVPDAITQFYRAQVHSSPIHISVREHDLRARDVEFFQYSVLPTVVLLLTISGLITSGLSAAGMGVENSQGTVAVPYDERGHYCGEGTSRICDLLRAGIARAWTGLCLGVDATSRRLLAHNAAHVGVGGAV